ncbi:MAG: N-acyl-D-amino-acid deacylase family protein [Candidatus Latescibacterota bacterium]
MNEKKTRRAFLTASARFGAIGLALPVLGCSGSANEQFDVLITGGEVYDGSGNPGMEMDIGIRGDRIAAVQNSLKRSEAKIRIDARGLAVSPGFIDPHTHTDEQLLINPKAESKIRQGVTLEIGGNCGGSIFPKTGENAGQDVNDFYHQLEQKGIALNYASLVGHATIRNRIMGRHDRKPTAEEMQLMKAALRESLEAGAVGMSTGLYYAPGSFAAMEEIVELCRELVPYGGVYATHMRDEGDMVVESIDETIATACQSGASLQISHLKTMYPRNFGKISTVLEKIDAAQREGIAVLADRDPYVARSTSLSALFPRWTQEGASSNFVPRLKDPALDARIREHIRGIEEKLVSWDTIMICGLDVHKDSPIVGKTVLQASKEAGKPPYEFTRDLLIAENGGVSIVNFAMNEENLRRVLAHPLVVVASDGYSLAPYGELSAGKPHLRNYGTFTRVLGKYVREEKTLTLPEAIRKMTALSAEKFGLTGRGSLREGGFADVTIFNPDTVADSEDWMNPHQYGKGIEYVLVNGQVAIEKGEHTGALPGRCIRRGRG